MDDLKVIPTTDEPTIVITRTLNAPRALVWKAMTEPEHVIRWWGLNSHVNTIKRFDMRVGGSWRIESRDPEGNVFTFIGDYLEITPIERTVQTFGVEGMFDGAFATETMTLTEAGTKTLYKVVSRFDNAAMRDGMIASGMEVGLRQTLLQLDALLEELKEAA